MRLKLTFIWFLFSIFLFSGPLAYADFLFPTYPCAKPKINDAAWCTCYHNYMQKICFMRGGSRDICRDENLQRILAPKVIELSRYYKSHPSENMESSVMYGVMYYFTQCPLVKFDEEIKKRVFNIQNMNVGVETKLTKHVLFIGLDGVRRDSFAGVYNYLEKEKKEDYFLYFVRQAGINYKFYAGGDEVNQQPTSSEVGWVSMLTGNLAYKHNIVTNGDIAVGKYNHHIPTIYNIIRHNYPHSIVASFSDLKALAMLATYEFYGRDNANRNYFYNANNYEAEPAMFEQMTNDIVRALRMKVVPTFIYAHYGYSDETGHLKGFNPNGGPYFQSILQELYYVNSVLKEVVRSNESWLVIITTDHGGHQFIHGSQLPSDRNTFAIIGEWEKGHFTSHKIAEQFGQTAFIEIIKKYLHH